MTLTVPVPRHLEPRPEDIRPRLARLGYPDEMTGLEPPVQRLANFLIAAERDLSHAVPLLRGPSQWRPGDHRHGGRTKGSRRADDRPLAGPALRGASPAALQSGRAARTGPRRRNVRCSTASSYADHRRSAGSLLGSPAGIPARPDHARSVRQPNRRAARPGAHLPEPRARIGPAAACPGGSARGRRGPHADRHQRRSWTDPARRRDADLRAYAQALARSTIESSCVSDRR